MLSFRALNIIPDYNFNFTYVEIFNTVMYSADHFQKALFHILNAKLLIYELLKNFILVISEMKH